MQLKFDDREKQVFRSDTLKVFGVLTAVSGLYATYYPWVSHFVPPQAAVGVVFVMGVIGTILRFRPQIQTGVDVLTGDEKLGDVITEIVNKTPVATNETPIQVTNLPPIAVEAVAVTETNTETIPMSEEKPRNFTDDDIEALIDAFWRRVKLEIGGGILKSIGAAFIAFLIGACALGLAVKFKIINPH